MFIQDVFDDVTKNWRKPFAYIIGLPVTIFIIMVMVPVALMLLAIYPIIMLLDSKWVTNIGSAIRHFFIIIFCNVKKCKKCGTWENIGEWNIKYCKCDTRQ